ncbi:MAG: ABC transporter substrate-binding protein [Candidatus Komeilibacteria bacterium]|nr:ABC transporter substrate-binding protein [Candidatus Komeilibacteria bacterium]
MREKILLSLMLILALTGCQLKNSAGQNSNIAQQPAPQPQVIKVGYFPNITHAQALVGIANGMFQQALGSDVKIETITFNAGPAEIEALYAGAIDLGYIGPSPAVNGYVKSTGEALRIISGSASGGASLVVTPELKALFEKNGPAALAGKKIASPQQGNTQDISLRHYLKENNLTAKTTILPIANADQLTMFSQKQIDGAWAPEPWATRLIQEAGGVRLIDERTLWPNSQFCTTNIIVSAKFLNEHRDLVKKWLAAQVSVTEWIKANPADAQKTVNAEIEKLTTKKLADKVLTEAWPMLDFTVDPLKTSVYTFADWAFQGGFLGDTKPNLDNLYDLSSLNEVANQQY